ncbi:MAG: cobalamin-independent methionine synthase II family protein, partial [Alphaproteobacteria bacterium]|nr:cobalamin-independent methionine synthase II family protein [Alphaproteobacteria bacterium]
MKISRDRILTTHVGSLPRPDDLAALLAARDRGEPYDAPALAARVKRATDEIVARQAEVGLDVVNDGEMGKFVYATYVKERLQGFKGEKSRPVPKDLQDFPTYAKRLGWPAITRPVCSAPLAYMDQTAISTDIGNLAAALQAVKVVEGFMTAASPGVVSAFLKNAYYPSHEAYLMALADIMKREYDAIHAAGFVLQLDCPDLAMSRHIHFNDVPLETYLAMQAQQVEALNQATRDIPPEAMRLHLCWGNYEGPHHHDAPLEVLLPNILKARPAGLSFEAANPRHAHEWKVLKAARLPESKVLFPGVLDTTSNRIEHPELIADRICVFADIVGRERVIASTDCGF